MARFPPSDDNLRAVAVLAGVERTNDRVFKWKHPNSAKRAWQRLMRRTGIRGWLIVAQLGLASAIAALAFHDPAQSRGKIAAASQNA